MDILVDNKILVKNYTDEMLKYCNLMLKMPNPEYYKKEAMGKWTGNIEKEIVLFEKAGNSLLLPFGCLKSLWRNFGNKVTAFEANFKPTACIDYKSDIKPYEYQKQAIERILAAKNGVCVMPCGSGKTQTALEVVARLGMRTLWLTHTQDLLTQSYKRARACFGLDEKEYGTITRGKVSIGNAITFATVQTLSNIDLTPYKRYFDVIIVDECHKAVGTPTNIMMFYKVLSGLSARYKIGITATARRADRTEKCMFAIIGGIIHETPQEAVADKVCSVKVRQRMTEYKANTNLILASDGTIVYSNLVEDIITNEKRNAQIVKDLKELDGAALILSDRVAHLDTLHKNLNLPNESRIARAITGSKESRKLRDEMLTDLNSGKIKYLFATYSLAKEGLDIPTLKYLVMATPQKDKVTVTQSAGRVERKADGKDHGTIIDYVDNFGLLKGYAKKRINIYKNKGYNMAETVDSM